MLDILVRYFDSSGSYSSLLIFARIPSLRLSEYVTSPQIERALLPQTCGIAADLGSGVTADLGGAVAADLGSGIQADVASGIAADLGRGIALPRVSLLVVQTRHYCSGACWCRGSR